MNGRLFFLRPSASGEGFGVGQCRRSTFPTPTPTLKGRGSRRFSALALAVSLTAPAAAQIAPVDRTDQPRPAFQFLYGSGEAAALARQAYAMIAANGVAAARHRPRESVVLAANATVAAPAFERCGRKPLAAVFDADETAIYNLGVEEAVARAPVQAFDEAQWERWERTGAGSVVAVPGAREAFAALRRAGVTVIVNTNRTTTNAAGTIAALRAAGLGDFRLGDTLYLKPAGAGSAKDGRRRQIAARYCVVAMAGDQLGDFSDLFNAHLPVDQRRAAVLSAPVARLWGNGWYVLPNPVYGTAIGGTFDQVFPAASHWTDPGANSDRARP